MFARNLFQRSLAFGAGIGCWLAVESASIAGDRIDLLNDPAGAASLDNAVAPADGDMDNLGKRSANPLGDLWFLWTQYDATRFKGDLLDSEEWLHNIKFQPVMSFPIFNDTWNFIMRPVFQYNSIPLDKKAGKLLNASQQQIITDPNLAAVATDPFGRTEGFGDTALLTLLGPAKLDGLIWGFGASQIFPTAEEDVLGQGKYQAGPAFLAVRIAPTAGGGLFESSNIGALVQHWWSYAGDDDRADTNMTDIQYFFNYRIDDVKMIGMAPNIRINWEADGDDRFSIPVGLGYTDIIKFGKLPIRVAAEAQYYVHQPDSAGADWNFRVVFAPIIPALFGR